VDDALFMRRQQGFCALDGHRQEFFQGEGPLQAGAERRTLDVLHHQEGFVFLLQQLVNDGDVWVGEAGSQFGLLEESLPVVFIGPQL